MPALRKSDRYTLEEYLEIDANSEERFEYYDGQLFPLSDVSERHDAIERNLNGQLFIKLRGKKCRNFLANMRLQVPSNPPYRYGDGSALCGTPIFDKVHGVDVLTNPQLIIEILSSSTEKYDQNAKFKQHKSIESFREYLLISQELPFVTQFVRHNEKFWMQTQFDRMTEIVKLETLDCELTLAEIYEEIEFTEEELNPIFPF